MASGSFNKVFHNSYKLIVNWSSTANTNSNSSTVTTTIKLYCPYALSINSRTGNSISINGVSYSFNTSAISTSGGTTHTLATVTSNAISHNTDGTKTITITCDFNLNATLSGTYYGTITATSSVVLDTIPRASTISCSSANVGHVATITINKASANFLHTLSYSFGSLSGTIVTKTNASTYGWLIPDTFYDEIGTNGKSKSGTLTCQTYSSGTLIGSTTCSFTVSINTDENAPILNVNVYDSNSKTIALTGDNSKLIKYYSDASYTLQATAQGGASIGLTYAQCGNQTQYNQTSGTFSGITTNTFKFQATDSRNISTVKTITATMIDYIRLTCDMDAENPSASGNTTITISGNYFNGSFGKTSNTLTVQYRYKVGNGSYGSWTTASATKSGNTYTATVNLTGLDYRQNYTFQGRATDKLLTVNSFSDSVQSIPVFDWSSTDFNFNVPVNFSAGATGLDGGGGGGYYGTCATGSTTAAKVVVCSDFKNLKEGASILVKFTNTNTHASPTLNVNGTGAYRIRKYGTTGAMGYAWFAGEVKQFLYDGSYWLLVDGGVATTSTYGKTKLSSSVSSDSTTALTPSAVNDLIEYGTWTPSCNYISSPTQKIGSYVKIGTMCIVNWSLYGNATTSGDMLYISGLPYTPSSSYKWQSGGGSLSNGRVPANRVFSGYNIENGYIYARSSLWASSASNRASSYVGATSGTTIYTSGTIMYKVS